MTADERTPERSWIIAALIFAVNVALVHPVFFPSLHEIGGWDESIYINSGRELVEHGTVPQLAKNPFVAVLYALTYLPVQSSPYWLVHSCSLARFLLFGLMWLASYLVAGRLKGVAHPLIMVVLVAISPALTGLLSNGSNALFAAMSGFGLWQLLAFQQTRETRHLWRCSAFVGLAWLSRNEGPILLLNFLALAAVFGFRDPRSGRIAFGRLTYCLAAALIPAIVIVESAVLTRGLQTGNFDLGTRERSYFTFEQGHGMAFADTYGSLQAYVEGQNDAPKLFGTAEENDNSILRAIRRNPSAYFQRVPRLAKSAVKYGFAVYNWHFAVICFLLAGRGLFELLRRRSYEQLASLVIWQSFAALYVLLCFQAGHLLIPYLSVFALAAIGVSAIAANLESRMERRFWTVAAVVLAAVVLAVYRGPNDLALAPVLLALGLWLMWLLGDAYPFLRQSTTAAFLVLLPVLLVTRLGVVHAEPRVLGTTPDERATQFLRSRFPERTVIGAYAPGKVWSAGMEHAQIVNLRDLRSAADVWAWMDRHRVEAIFSDTSLRTFEPAAWQMLQGEIGNGLEIGFTETAPPEAGGETVIVLVRSPGSRTAPAPPPVISGT